MLRTGMVRVHSIVAAVLVLAAWAADAGPAAAQGPAPVGNLSVFMQGRLLGSEQATVTVDGRRLDHPRHGPPGRPGRSLDHALRDAVRPRVAADQPRGGGHAARPPLIMRTTFAGGNATTDITQAGQQTQKVDAVSADPVVLPNMFFCAYEALALRLRGITVPGELKAYIAAQAEIPLRVTARGSERIQTAGRAVSATRYELTIENPGSPIQAEVWIDEDEAASCASGCRRRAWKSRAKTSPPCRPASRRWAAPTTSRCGSRRPGSPSRRPCRSRRRPRSRRLPARRRPTSCRRSSWLPGPAPSIATRPWPASRCSPSWPTASPTPASSSCATTSAASGQSGGRDESATIQDYADDVRAVVEFLRKRKDVDPRSHRRRRAQRGRPRGHAGGRQRGVEESRRARAAGHAGHDGRRTGPRAAAVPPRQDEAARRREAEPHRAAAEDPGGGRRAGTGWEGIPEAYRKQADTPWFRSFLAFDPAEGDQPRSSSPSSSSRPSATGRCRRRGTASCCSTPRRAGRSSPTPSLVTIDGVNHLFVPAETGDVDEYALLQDKRVSSKVIGCTRAVVEGQAACGCCGRWTLTSIIPCRSG